MDNDVETLELRNLEIVLPAEASAVEKFAAEELRDCLFRASGTRLPLGGPEAGGKGKIFLGGDGGGLFPAWNKARGELRHDGFATISEGGNLLVSGNNSRGTLNGVYALLRCQGCRWVYPRKAEEIIPPFKALTPRRGAVVSNPDLELRGVCIFPVSAGNTEELRALIDWMGKNRFNLLMTSVRRTEKRPDGWKVEWEAVSDELLPELRKRGIILNISEHSGRYFFPTSYFDAHPEWFAMNAAGERFSTGQMCYSNEEAVATLTENFAAYAAAHPEVDILGTWPEDGYGFCQCGKCRQPGAVLKAVNRIAERIERVRPDLTVEYLSYTKETSDVPPDILPRANMSILVANTRVAREWLDKSNRAGGRGVYQLHYQIADNTAMRTNLPLRFEKTRQDCQDAARTGLRGIIPFFIGVDTWWRSSLNLHFLSEFSWDTGKSADEVLGDFCRAYYGAAAEEMATAFKALETMPPISLDAPPPWPLWQSWPTLRTDFAGENHAAKLKYFSDLRGLLATARSKGTGVPARRFDAMEAFIAFHETMLAAWHGRALAVLAFDRNDAAEVRKHVVETARHERRLVELLETSLATDDGVNGARCDYDFFQNWRLQQDKQLLEMRTEEQRKPFMDDNPDVEMFLPGLLGL